MTTNLRATPKNYDPDLDGPLEEYGQMVEAKMQQAERRNPLTGSKARTKSGSFAAAVADLEVGDCATRTHTLNDQMTLAELARDMREMKDQISNNARSSVRIAQERTNNQYRVETGETITTSGRVYLNVIVTRVL